ncbi:MAG TPA: hypothetical protein VLV54_22215 [Thermoanaerobaculia bacterium]|nr:hypothetical protein [Thermoanaerobaculia bacterium]
MRQSPNTDEANEPVYLTGEISVRFTTSPGDEDLRRFTARYGLRLLRRNEFVREQVVFEPVDASRSLYDLVQEIEREGAAKAVWANTLRRFHRAA